MAVNDITRFAQDHWMRALDSFATARREAEYSPDSTANRSYYSAFHAVSAFFALQGRAFKKHTNLRGAVHRALVKTGIWPQKLGDDFDDLMKLRHTGDYGVFIHVNKQQARWALQAATRILKAVHKAHPDLFALDI